MGIGARGWANYLTGPVDLAHGWRKHNASANFQTWNIPISHVLREPGIYRLTLDRAGGVGSNNIIINAMAVEVGGKTVWLHVKEVRPRIEEIMALPAAGANKAILRIQAKGDGGTDSYGSITLEPFFLRRAKQ
jgi:hypothetical protein